MSPLLLDLPTDRPSLITRMMLWARAEVLQGLVDGSPLDRFGRPRGMAYRQEDYALCDRPGCVDLSKPLTDEAQQIPGTCPRCGGYGEVPVSSLGLVP